ncbi:MAG: serine/threonine-protein kinase [Acidobacteriota bacterium]
MKECPVCNSCFGDHMNVCDRDQSLLQELLPGAPIIGKRYRLDRKIGAGTMGIVFQGTEIETGKTIAVKIISPELLYVDPGLVDLFVQHGRAATTLQHPNIVRVFDYGRTSHNLLYLIMEYLEGCTLTELLNQQGKLSIKHALSIITQVCEAIAGAHRFGIHHRDLKPSNVFITIDSNGQEIVKVLDFGIARLKTVELLALVPTTVRETLLSNPYYMAPEQFEGTAIDARADIYAIGVLLYHIFTGQLPFYGSSYDAIKEQHLKAAAPPLRQLRPEAPATIETIIMKTLEKQPSQRFTTVFALAVQLAAQQEALAQTVIPEIIATTNPAKLEHEQSSTSPEQKDPAEILPLMAVMAPSLAYDPLATNPGYSFPEEDPLQKTEPTFVTISDQPIGELSPTSLVYLFPQQFLPELLAGQRRHVMHKGFITERERLAAMLITVALFSLRRRSVIEIAHGPAAAARLPRSMRPRHNQGFIVYANNLEEAWLDALEEKILSALKKTNPSRFYNIFLHIAQTSVATVEREAICEIVADCIAEDLATRRLLRPIRRKPPIEPGESAIQYEAAAELDPFTPQVEAVQGWLLSLQQEGKVDLAGKQVQPFNYIFKYYTDLFRHNSRELVTTE